MRVVDLDSEREDMGMQRAMVSAGIRGAAYSAFVMFISHTAFGHHRARLLGLQCPPTLTCNACE